jgi:signal transduction histidine kinase
MKHLLPEILNVRILNALMAVGLLFLYMLFARAYYVTKRDRALFFWFVGLGWLLNVIYLVLEDLNQKYFHIPEESRLTIVLSLNTLSMFFFLLGARQRLLSRYPKVFKVRTIATLSGLVFVIPIIVHIYFPSHFWISEVIAVLFCISAIFAVGRSYQTFFWVTHQYFPTIAKYCLVLSLYFYAALQFGHFFRGYQDYFFIAGMLLKLVHISGLILFSISFFSEYTEKHLAYEQARQAFQLADQLAHELNTPATEMRLRLGKLETNYRNSSFVLEQSVYTSNLIEQIVSLVAGYRNLRFGLATQKGERRPETCNINSVCDSAIMTLKLVMKPNVRFIKQYSASPLVYAQISKLFQIFKNIIKNAIEANENISNALIRVETTTTKDSEHRTVEVKVKISDTGPGIEERILPKIFDAGFTTKRSPGRGHGLYIARKLVEEIQGRIYVKPRGEKPFSGACFEVILPYFSGLKPRKED